MMNTNTEAYLPLPLKIDRTRKSAETLLRDSSPSTEIIFLSNNIHPIFPMVGLILCNAERLERIQAI